MILCETQRERKKQHIRMPVSGPSAADGEAAIVAMVATAQLLFEALRTGADEKAVQALHREYEAHWSNLCAAAAVLEEERAHVGDTTGSAPADASQIAALQDERQQLQRTLALRNGELKEQIDMLRDLLCSAQLTNL
jgi:hypothetical protein